MRRLQCLLILALFLYFKGQTQTPFHSGNILLSRIGDGTLSLVSTRARPAFIDEYTPSGQLVQSIPLSNALTPNRNLVFKGVNYMEGGLSLSADGRYITLCGYNAPVNTSSVGLISVEKTIARIDLNGAVNTSTALAPEFPVSHASVTSNGSDIWIGHALGTSSVEYLTFGSNTPTPITSADQIYFLQIDNGQLFCTNADGNMFRVGTGLPTTSPQNFTLVPGIATGAGSFSSFFFADLNPAIPGSDVLYVVSLDNRGLQKYSFDGTNWVSKGIIGGDADDYIGITGIVSGSSVILYAIKTLDASTTGFHDLVSLVDASGYNGTLTGTPTFITSAATDQAFRGITIVPQPPSISLSAKVYLQGAYNSGLGRHKNVTPSWASILNANALNQPYSAAPFNYAGSESVAANFFTSDDSRTDDVVDWVLLELHDAANPATVIARQAAFVLEDGRVVSTDKISNPTFTGVGANNYYIVIKHRNHLAIRSSSTVFVNGATPVLYDFTTNQSQAYQDPAITPVNPAMKDLGSGVFGMFGGNVNSNIDLKFTGLNNDYGSILTALNGQQGSTLSSVYNNADLNLDGIVKFTSLNNDPGILLTSLGGNQGIVVKQHQ